jgi:hypothetical protein
MEVSGQTQVPVERDCYFVRGDVIIGPQTLSSLLFRHLLKSGTRLYGLVQKQEFLQHLINSKLYT